MSESKTGRMTKKSTLVGLIVLMSALAFLASVQQWLAVALLPGAATVESLSVTGQQISPALTLIALASLAAALVLMIAGKWFRWGIALLVIVLGSGLAFSGVQAILNPLDGASGQIEAVSGISGDAQSGLVASLDVSVWPALTVGIGAVLALVGVLVLLFGSRWKTGGRKYESGDASPRERTATAPTDDRISEWDALSDGGDPTELDEDPALDR